MSVPRWSAAEIATLLKVTVQAIHRARLRGQLKGTRTGKSHWVYLEPDVAAYLEWRLRR